MKKNFIFLMLAFAMLKATAQNNQWTYDFGTATSAPYTSATYSTTYLPPTQSLGGTTGVRASSATDGPVQLVATGMAGGSGAELKMTSGTTTTGAKFGLSTYSGSTVGTFQCKINIASGSNGRFILFLGNGANFSNAGSLNVTQTFASLRFSPGASSVGIDWLLSSASPNYTTTGLTQTTITTNQSYRLQFFMNNSNADTTYTTGSGATLSTNTLPKGTFDIWLNDTKILANAHPSTGLLAQGTIINSMNFLNIGAGTSAPVAYLDDISYSNFLPSNIPPPTLSAIDSIKNKYVNWLTGTNVDYSNQYVAIRYNRIKYVYNSNIGGTQDLSAYNFASPGAVWDFTDDDQSAMFADLVQDHLIRFVYMYQIKGTPSNPNPAYHRSTLRDTILNIFNYIQAKGVNSNTNFAYTLGAGPEDVITSHYGISLNSSAYATAILLMKDDLKTAGIFANHIGALNALTVFVGPDYLPSNPTYPSNPGMNSDIVRSAIQQRLCYILASDDTAKSVTYMAFFKKYVDNALMVANGWNDCIKPDFMNYHHRGVYTNTYGLDALNEASVINLMLKGSRYELSALAQSNLKNAVMSYRNFCTDLTMPYGLTGRLINTDTYDILRPAYANLYVADTAANVDAGREFIRLWNIAALVTTPTNLNLSLAQSNVFTTTLIHTLGSMQDIANLLASGLPPADTVKNGQFNFPNGGLSVHRYNGSFASVKGTSKIIWDYENSSTENLFGQYGSSGAIELLTTGNPKTHLSNGYNITGLDWAHIPGTTATNLPFSVMQNSIDSRMNTKAFLAHASLDGNGVFAMDYEDMNSATGKNPKMTALKTDFFFNDKILCLGSNIKGVSSTYPIHTTLFQTAFANGNTSIINGNTISGNTYTNTSNAGSTWWATDALGNGYVVPQSIYNTDIITLARASQTTPLQSNSGTGTNDFAKAYIDHGVAPSAANYQYAIWMQGGAGTQDLATNFANYFTVIKQDAQAHAAKYIPDSIYAYAIFDSTYVFSTDVLKKVDKPAVVMTQTTNGSNGLKLSLTNPNLGLLASNEFYTWSQISQNASILNRLPQIDVVKLTLRGTWTLVTPMSNVSTTNGGDSTQIFFSTINGQTIQAQLVKSAILPLNGQLFATRDNLNKQMLNWTYAEDGRQIKSLTIEKSSNATDWQQEANLVSTTKNYLFDHEGVYFVRLAIVHVDGSKVFSNIVKLAANNSIVSKISFSPNPAVDQVTIKSNSGNITVQKVVNAAGANVIGQVSIQHIFSGAQLNIDRLAKGLYLVEIMQNNTKQVVKFIKQ